MSNPNTINLEYDPQTTFGKIVTQHNAPVRNTVVRQGNQIETDIAANTVNIIKFKAKLTAQNTGGHPIMGFGGQQLVLSQSAGGNASFYNFSVQTGSTAHPDGRSQNSLISFDGTVKEWIWDWTRVLPGYPNFYMPYLKVDGHPIDGGYPNYVDPNDGSTYNLTTNEPTDGGAHPKSFADLTTKFFSFNGTYVSSASTPLNKGWDAEWYYIKLYKNTMDADGLVSFIVPQSDGTFYDLKRNKTYTWYDSPNLQSNISYVDTGPKVQATLDSDTINLNQAYKIRAEVESFIDNQSPTSSLQIYAGNNIDNATLTTKTGSFSNVEHTFLPASSADRTIVFKGRVQDRFNNMFNSPADSPRYGDRFTIRHIQIEPQQVFDEDRKSTGGTLYNSVANPLNFGVNKAFSDHSQGELIKLNIESVRAAPANPSIVNIITEKLNQDQTVNLFDGSRDYTVDASLDRYVRFKQGSAGARTISSAADAQLLDSEQSQGSLGDNDYTSFNKTYLFHVRIPKAEDFFGKTLELISGGSGRNAENAVIYGDGPSAGTSYGLNQSPTDASKFSNPFSVNLRKNLVIRGGFQDEFSGQISGENESPMLNSQQTYRQQTEFRIPDRFFDGRFHFISIRREQVDGSPAGGCRYTFDIDDHNEINQPKRSSGVNIPFDVPIKTDRIANSNGPEPYHRTNYNSGTGLYRRVNRVNVDIARFYEWNTNLTDEQLVQAINNRFNPPVTKTSVKLNNTLGSHNSPFTNKFDIQIFDDKAKDQVLRFSGPRRFNSPTDSAGVAFNQNQLDSSGNPTYKSTDPNQIGMAETVEFGRDLLQTNSAGSALAQKVIDDTSWTIAIDIAQFIYPGPGHVGHINHEVFFAGGKSDKENIGLRGTEGNRKIFYRDTFGSYWYFDGTEDIDLNNKRVIITANGFNRQTGGFDNQGLFCYIQDLGQLHKDPIKYTATLPPGFGSSSPCLFRLKMAQYGNGYASTWAGHSDPAHWHFGFKGALRRVTLWKGYAGDTASSIGNNLLYNRAEFDHYFGHENQVIGTRHIEDISGSGNHGTITVPTQTIFSTKNATNHSQLSGPSNMGTATLDLDSCWNTQEGVNLEYGGGVIQGDSTSIYSHFVANPSGVLGSGQGSGITLNHDFEIIIKAKFIKNNAQNNVILEGNVPACDIFTKEGNDNGKIGVRLFDSSDGTVALLRLMEGNSRGQPVRQFITELYDGTIRTFSIKRRIQNNHSVYIWDNGDTTLYMDENNAISSTSNTPGNGGSGMTEAERNIFNTGVFAFNKLGGQSGGNHNVFGISSIEIFGKDSSSGDMKRKHFYNFIDKPGISRDRTDNNFNGFFSNLDNFSTSSIEYDHYNNGNTEDGSELIRDLRATTPAKQNAGGMDTRGVHLQVREDYNFNLTHIKSLYDYPRHSRSSLLFGDLTTGNMQAGTEGGLYLNPNDSRIFFDRGEAFNIKLRYKSGYKNEGFNTVPKYQIELDFDGDGSPRQPQTLPHLLGGLGVHIQGNGFPYEDDGSHTPIGSYYLDQDTSSFTGDSYDTNEIKVYIDAIIEDSPNRTYGHSINSVEPGSLDFGINQENFISGLFNNKVTSGAGFGHGGFSIRRGSKFTDNRGTGGFIHPFPYGGGNTLDTLEYRIHPRGIFTAGTSAGLSSSPVDCGGVLVVKGKHKVYDNQRHKIDVRLKNNSFVAMVDGKIDAIIPNITFDLGFSADRTPSLNLDTYYGGNSPSGAFIYKSGFQFMRATSSAHNPHSSGGALNCTAGTIYELRYTDDQQDHVWYAGNDANRILTGAKSGSSAFHQSPLSSGSLFDSPTGIWTPFTRSSDSPVAKLALRRGLYKDQVSSTTYRSDATSQSLGGMLNSRKGIAEPSLVNWISDIAKVQSNVASQVVNIKSNSNVKVSSQAHQQSNRATAYWSKGSTYQSFRDNSPYQSRGTTTIDSITGAPFEVGDLIRSHVDVYDRTFTQSLDINGRPMIHRFFATEGGSYRGGSQAWYSRNSNYGDVKIKTLKLLEVGQDVFYNNSTGSQHGEQGLLTVSNSNYDFDGLFGGKTQLNVNPTQADFTQAAEDASLPLACSFSTQRYTEKGLQFQIGGVILGRQSTGFGKLNDSAKVTESQRLAGIIQDGNFHDIEISRNSDGDISITVDTEPTFTLSSTDDFQTTGLTYPNSMSAQQAWKNCALAPFAISGFGNTPFNDTAQSHLDNSFKFGNHSGRSQSGSGGEFNRTEGTSEIESIRVTNTGGDNINVDFNKFDPAPNGYFQDTAITDGHGIYNTEFRNAGKSFQALTFGDVNTGNGHSIGLNIQITPQTLRKYYKFDKFDSPSGVFMIDESGLNQNAELKLFNSSTPIEFTPVKKLSTTLFEGNTNTISNDKDNPVAYIDTGIIPTDNHSFEIVGRHTGPTQNVEVTGVFTEGDSPNFGFGQNGSRFLQLYYGTHSIDTTIPTDDNTIHTFRVEGKFASQNNKGSLYIDGELQATAAADSPLSNMTTNFMIFGASTQDYSGSPSSIHTKTPFEFISARAFVQNSPNDNPVQVYNAVAGPEGTLLDSPNGSSITLPSSGADFTSRVRKDFDSTLVKVLNWSTTQIQHVEGPLNSFKVITGLESNKVSANTIIKDNKGKDILLSDSAEILFLPDSPSA